MTNPKPTAARASGKATAGTRSTGAKALPDAVVSSPSSGVRPAGRRGKLAVVEPGERQRLNQALWVRYFEEGDPAVREQLILQYAPLVKYVMGRLAISLPAILDYEDILSFGTIGLIEAVERFDHTKGVKFETYAISRIRGAIIDALRSLDRLPRSVRQKARNANEAILRLTNELGRDPTDEEVAAAMGIGPDAYRQAQVEAS